MEMKPVGAGLVPARNQDHISYSIQISGRHKAGPYIAFSFLFLTLFVFADPPQDLYHSGNQLYAEGKFADAAQKYQAAADANLKNWILEYDLGNAYYRAGQAGKAILHYERAFQLNSGQGDILYNLNLATTKVGDPELPTTALPTLLWRLFYLLSINTLTLLMSALFIILGIAAGMVLFFSNSSSSAVVGGGSMDPRHWPSGMTAGIIFSFLVCGLWLSARIYLLEKPIGVVTSSVAEVRSGPNTTYPANFTVPEGHRVLILKEEEPIQGWIEIGVPAEGLKGWVPETSVEVI